MRSSESRVAGRHSCVRLTRRTALGSDANGFTAPNAMPRKFMYSIADVPGHWHEGSLETAVNGLPTRPLFVTFMITLPTFSTEPAPKMSGIASGRAPRLGEAFALTRAWTSSSYALRPWYSGSSGRRRAAAGRAKQAIATTRPRHLTTHFDE